MQRIADGAKKLKNKETEKEMSHWTKRELKELIISNLDVLCNWTKKDLQYWDKAFERLKLKNI